MARNRLQIWIESTLEETRSIRTILWNFILFPVRVLFWPFQLLGLFHAPELKVTDKHYRPPLRLRIWNWVNRAVQAPFWGLSSFFKAIWFRAFRMRLSDWLWITPLVAMLMILGFVFTMHLFRTEAIDNKYHQQAKTSFAKGDFALARSFFERYQREAELTPVQQFFWAEILQKTGEPKRASEIIDGLAPNDEVGVAQAHLIKALNITRTLKRSGKEAQQNDPQILQNLKWHLTHCGSEAPIVMESWALLHSTLGEFDRAIDYLNRSAQEQPTHYLLLAAVCNRAKRFEERNEALEAARKEFAGRVKADSLDNKSRLILADVLIRQSNFVEAEKTLTMAFVQDKSPEVRKKFAALYLLQFELLVRQNPDDIATLFKLLNRALQIKPDDLAVFQRMMVLYQSSKKRSPEAAEKLLDSLRELASGGDESALAHVALSQIHQSNREDDKAIYHLEAAIQLNGSLALAQNNLAWLLASQAEPDLDRALSLAKEAAKQLPRNGSIADTLGSIQMKMGANEEASQAFRIAIDANPDKPALHEKMAQVLDKMDMGDMAEVHRRRAKKLRSTN